MLSAFSFFWLSFHPGPPGISNFTTSIVWVVTVRRSTEFAKCQVHFGKLEQIFPWIKFEWVSCGFIEKRPTNRWIPRQSQQSSVLETRSTRWKNSIIENCSWFKPFDETTSFSECLECRHSERKCPWLQIMSLILNGVIVVPTTSQHTVYQ